MGPGTGLGLIKKQQSPTCKLPPRLPSHPISPRSVHLDHGRGAEGPGGRGREAVASLEETALESLPSPLPSQQSTCAPRRKPLEVGELQEEGAGFPATRLPRQTVGLLP